MLKRLKPCQSIAQLKNGWLIVKPTNPLIGRESRVDRMVLGEYLRKLASRKPLSLDEQASFTLTMPPKEDNFLPNQLASLFGPAHETQDPDALRLYGLLSPEQRQTAASSGLSISNLNEKELELVNRLVYGATSRLQYSVPPASADKGTELASLYFNGIMHEATESLPNGIPQQSLLTIAIKTAPVVLNEELALNDSTYRPSQTYSAGELAWQKSIQDHPNQFPDISSKDQTLDFNNLSFGPQREIILTLQFTKTLSVKLILEDINPANFNHIKLSELPDEFRKAFDKAYDEFQKSLTTLKPGDSKNKTKGFTPPPTAPATLL
jgi:hypothetical protein